MTERRLWLEVLSRRRATSDRDWTTVLVLSVTAGWCGADRFYVGAPTLGLLKLVSLGGLGVWWAADVALLPRVAMRDDEGRPLRRR